MINVPLSVGEVIDKLTILSIKQEKITDAAKLVNITREITTLDAAFRIYCATLSTEIGVEIMTVSADLKQVNLHLWDVEDNLRELERIQQFDDNFIRFARSVYRLNDRRAQLKRYLNEICRSELVEEKSYKNY